MLLSEEVEIGIAPVNMKHYEGLGYVMPRKLNKRGDMVLSQGAKITVKVSDLTPKSSVRVLVECDDPTCNKEPWLTKWTDYKKCVKEDGRYYCHGCQVRNGKKRTFEKSFYEWCIENNRRDFLNMWDLERNELTPKEVSCKSECRYYFKCKEDPQRKSVRRQIEFLTREKYKKIRFPEHSSFASYLISEHGEGAVEKYWDFDKNKHIDPYKLAYNNSTKTIFIKCQHKDYHGSYSTITVDFRRGGRCPYCSSNRLHRKDSLGYVYPETLVLWGENNKKSPYDYFCSVTDEVTWMCPGGKHEDFRRSISESVSCQFRCAKCTEERTESFLQEKVRLYLNSLNFAEVNHEHNTLIECINPKTGYRLRYDNEVISRDVKLVIEVHGEQHYHEDVQKRMTRNNEDEIYSFESLQWRDGFKKDFALSEGYGYLEIPYWTDNKDEEWKTLIDKKIKELGNKFNKARGDICVD